MSEEKLVSFHMDVSENNFKMELTGKQSDVYQLMKMASSIYESQEYKDEFSKQQTKGDA
jgi:hypothetical protein